MTFLKSHAKLRKIYMYMIKIGFIYYIYIYIHICMYMNLQNIMDYVY